MIIQNYSTGETGEIVKLSQQLNLTEKVGKLYKAMFFNGFVCRYFSISCLVLNLYSRLEFGIANYL